MPCEAAAVREEKLGMLLRGTDEGKHREYRKQKLMLLRGSGEGKNREQKIGTLGKAAARAEMGNVATHVVPWSGNKKKICNDAVRSIAQDQTCMVLHFSQVAWQKKADRLDKSIQFSRYFYRSYLIAFCSTASNRTSFGLCHKILIESIFHCHV